LVLRASTAQFRTGWFVESVISASLIVLIIRSRRPFFKSRPGKYLFAATLIIVALALVFPFIPLGGLFGFRPLPGSFLVMMGIIVIFYMICAELVKRSFFRRVSF
jgi:Mg2+-importing ATPase